MTQKVILDRQVFGRDGRWFTGEIKSFSESEGLVEFPFINQDKVALCVLNSSLDQQDGSESLDQNDWATIADHMNVQSEDGAEICETIYEPCVIPHVRAQTLPTEELASEEEAFSRKVKLEPEGRHEEERHCHHITLDGSNSLRLEPLEGAQLGKPHIQLYKEPSLPVEQENNDVAVKEEPNENLILATQTYRRSERLLIKELMQMSVSDVVKKEEIDSPDECERRKLKVRTASPVTSKARHVKNTIKKITKTTAVKKCPIQKKGRRKANVAIKGNNESGPHKRVQPPRRSRRRADDDDIRVISCRVQPPRKVKVETDALRVGESLYVDSIIIYDNED